MTTTQTHDAPSSAHLETAPPYRTVVLGIDFAPPSLAAARWAMSYVAPGAEAILAHVAPPPAPETEALMESLPSRAGGLGGFAATLHTASARTVVRVGRPSRWLSAVATEVGASLVVLGRRKDAGRRRVGEPNVLERIVRRTSAAVLRVPEGTAEPLGHVIAAVDESDVAASVLDAARRLARLHGCPLTVLHVLSPAEGAYDRVVRAARRRRAGDADGAPADASRAAAAAGVPAETARWLAERERAWRGMAEHVKVVAGDPCREISSSATATGCAAPLIVVGQRGADGAPPGSLGSVARELLARAPFPVLAVA